MKEVLAIIRRDKLSETKAGLLRIGVPGLTYASAEGRGKTKGVDHSKTKIGEVKLARSQGFVPKILVSVIVEDGEMEGVVNKIIAINHTGVSGDGKIFVCPLEGCTRIRTGEQGSLALR
ncbi:MAG: P-II family nitrogen regulator [Methanomassiliicoccus sp.]|nr:P-II family nitrogen regulator [Methanomassiliicoccus sp.]